jgi:hypothetical protein
MRVVSRAEGPKRFRQAKTWLALTPYRRATSETEAPASYVAATISRFSASGHERYRRRPLKFLSINEIVDTSATFETDQVASVHDVVGVEKAAHAGGVLCQQNAWAKPGAMIACANVDEHDGGEAVVMVAEDDSGS